MNIFLISCLMGTYYWFSRLRFGYTFSSMLLQPIVIGVFVGLITGQMDLAMRIGAALQLVYLGVTSTPGGNVPSDPALAGCIAIPLGVMANLTPEIAVTLAIPFGVIGVFVDQIRRSTNAIWIHKADICAENADVKGIMKCAFLYPAIVGFLIRFPIVFGINFLGEAVASDLINQLPMWLLNSFEIMGGILPALGFAITVMVIGKKQLIPFFLLGYFMIVYCSFDIIAMAIFATILALVISMIMFRKEGITNV